MLDINVLAPMPMARVIRAIAVNPGAFLSIRNPYRISYHIILMSHSRLICVFFEYGTRFTQ